jgi:hypothetical protein
MSVLVWVTPVAVMMIRMKPLPRHHRIAHLRALIHQQPRASIRRRQLALLLRAELTALSPVQERAT